MLSAQHSLEDNWALRELGRCSSGRATFYWSGRPDGYEDDILIHADKNPNTTGVQRARPDAPSRSRQLVDDVPRGRVTHVIALGGVTPRRSTTRRRSRVREGWSTIAAHDGPAHRRARTVVLPATSWAEHSGTYVNAKGMRQVAEKALEPQGDQQAGLEAGRPTSRPRSGFEPTWTKLKQIRAQLTGQRGGGRRRRRRRRPSAARARSEPMTAIADRLGRRSRSSIMVMFVLNLAAILTWADRRQSAMIQDRIGPNRAVIKIFGKRVPPRGAPAHRPPTA